MGRQRGSAPPPRRLLGAALAAVIGLILLPALALAHPLGNFTINHYAGIRVEPDGIQLDVVVDQAEIPAFQARQGLDIDGDGALSSAEIDAGRRAGCLDLARSLVLQVDEVPYELEATVAGLTFPEGAGGLTTMRLVCGFEVSIPGGLMAGSTVSFADPSFSERIGWREIVVEASGVTVDAVDGTALRVDGSSERLTAYPEDQLARPLADDAVRFRVSAIDGAVLPEFRIPDAASLASTAIDPGASPTEAPVAAAPGAAAAIPGGVDPSDLPSIFRATDLTPWVLLLSVGTAAVLGAGHALTPGHGKTLMAAYLVGTRGTPLHAVGLGLSVTLSHTLGILALAAVIVGAQGVLAPDVVVRTAPIVAAVSIVAIGGWMLWSEIRRRRLAATANPVHGHDHGHPHEHPHDAHPTAATHEHRDDEPGHGEHSHGGVRHTHLPTPGTAITWRSLFVLGLAGGLIPSTSALLILLGSIAAGRPVFGFVLVVAFGLGMAVVMGGIGIVLVVARGRLDRVDAGSTLSRLGAAVPLAAAVLVLSLGVYLTIQAVSGAPVL